VTLERSYIAFAKPPLPAFLESGQDIATRKLIHCVGAKVEEKSDLARVQKDVVLIGHHDRDESLTIWNGAPLLCLHCLKLKVFWQIPTASATPEIVVGAQNRRGAQSLGLGAYND
jgi:hypothetical protein